ncbi:hypothetical protein N7478_008148 [Penicillium angulare]|uniref:uncharacterized protein n=1 Tax=Penicillium angulare TaxID=116970 RepID=UPI00254194F6|nr:uncharacterized protein N7478_008148 [Penicillium angulare]KAJ5273023.1 hypothetical protein N7478_008148 [Penicillium angulare]
MEANDRTIGIRSHNTREAYINRLVKKMLAPDSLIFPMRPEGNPQEEQDEQYTRRRVLGLLTAQSYVVAQFMHKIDVSIHGIRPYENGPPVGAFDPETPPKNWHACDMHDSEDISRLEGRRTVLIVWPAFWYILYEKRDKNGLIERESCEPPGYWEARDWWYVDEEG